MEKELLEKLVKERLTIGQLSKKIGKSKTTIRYWLDKYNFKTYKATHKEEKLVLKSKMCTKCSLEKNINEFYKRRDNKDISAYCKPCTNKQVLDRQRNFKKLCIEYKGGHCIVCNYNKCNGALEFHHLNPNEKDFTIANARLTSFNDKVKKELDKCILVCSNCHREIHSGLININDC